MEDVRLHTRIPVQFRASFTSVRVGTGEGAIVDLSPVGCRIESSEPVPVTTYLELRLEVSLKEPPILVDLAAVRWARGTQFGVQFLSLRREHQDRLNRVIEQVR